MIARSLALTKARADLSVIAKVHGGGITGQAEQFSLGLPALY